MFEDGRAQPADVDDVLVVGGSTLLPGVHARIEARFERRRLRAWQPFEAVAYGGACFAADRIGALDFIVHDYAFVTHDPKTGAAQHTVVVPRGTRFPTAPDLWKRQLVPTCSLGEPEQVFRLVICEIERGDGSDRRFVWDAAGDLHKVGGAAGKAELVVPLNAASPTLGYLDPPHEPQDRRPRLEIAFGVNAERWLVATVHDLHDARAADARRAGRAADLMSPWDLVTIGFVALVGLGSVVANAIQVRRRQRERIAFWSATAREAGWSAIAQAKSSVLEARAGGLQLQISSYAEQETEWTRVEIWGPRLAPELTLRREGAGFLGRRSPKEIEVGDEGFDEVVSVQGPLTLALALLDPDLRHAVATLVGGRLNLRGHRPLWVSGQLDAGVLRLDIPEHVPQLRRRQEDRELDLAGEVYLEGRYKLPDVLRAALDLAGRLEVPEHLAARLADNLKSEPEAGVRRKTLARLLSEFPEAAESAAALQAARDDPDADVRVRPRSRSASRAATCCSAWPPARAPRTRRPPGPWRHSTGRSRSRRPSSCCEARSARGGF